MPVHHSIVVPVYNEHEGIPALIDRFEALARRIEPETVEIILVNDGSQDGSEARLDEAARRNPIFKAIHLSRNFGHQLAITAGIGWAAGGTVTVIDADLQDPPEVILELLAKWREGFEVVYGMRRKRQGETRFKLWTARAFYRIIRRLTHVNIPVDTGDFRLMDRKAVDAFLKMEERNRFVRGMVSWIGFKQTGVLYDRVERVHGRTHYPLSKMLRLAVDGITSFSTIPLALANYFGVLTGIAALGVAGWALYIRFFTHETIQGWTSVMVAVLFIGAVQLFTLGIMGAYLGRTYEEVKRRPIFLVSRAVGFERDVGER